MKHTFDDIMGITIETGDAFLDKKLNSHICYKGGGGKQTATTSIPEWLRPHVEGFVQKGAAAEARGDLSKVAGFTQDQQQAMNLGRGAAEQQGRVGASAADAQQQALTGTGAFAAQDFSGQRQAYADQAREMLGGQLGQQAAGAAGRGTLGSARGQVAAARAREQTAGDLASKFAQLDQQDLAARRAAQQSAVGQTAGVQAGLGAQAQSLGKIGQQQQAQQQKQADATWQGLQRLGSLFGTASGTATDKTQTTGGGK